MPQTMKSMPLVPVLAALFTLAGCASTSRMVVSEGIPATEATVKVDKAANNNVALAVSVQHMATPAKVRSGATTYVVWAMPTGANSPQNLGALTVDKKLNGTLNTVLPFETFKVFITAEPTSQVTEPTGRELLEAHVQDGRAG